jgi:hypothetical protein
MQIAIIGDPYGEVRFQRLASWKELADIFFEVFQIDADIDVA